jgi:lipid-binding SYLF domain-containing protein
LIDNVFSKAQTHYEEVHLKTNLVLGIRLVIVAIILMLISGCASLSPEEQGPTRTELDKMSKKAIATLLETKPQLQALLDKSIGYVVVDMTVTKIPVVGTGAGYGVVIDRRTNTTSYIKVSQFEVGGGLGAEKYKVLIVFDDAKLLEKTAAGAWHYEAGASAASGSESAETAMSKSDKGYTAFKLSESGACVRVTVLMARAIPYLVDQQQ